MYQAEIANINIENLKSNELTKKNGKVSSAMLNKVRPTPFELRKPSKAVYYKNQ